MSDGRQEGPDCGFHPVIVSSTTKWAFFVGVSATENTAAVHFSSAPVTTTKAQAVISAAEAQNATFDDVLDALGEDASTLEDVPGGLKGYVVPAIRLQHQHHLP